MRRSERLLETELMRVLTSHIGGTASTITGSPMVSTFNDEKIALNQLPAKINAGSSGSVGLPSTEDNGEPSGKAGKSGDDILGRSAEVQSATHPTTSWSKSPAFFELCVNRSETLISLGEITLVDDRGESSKFPCLDAPLSYENAHDVDGSVFASDALLLLLLGHSLVNSDIEHFCISIFLPPTSDLG